VAVGAVVVVAVAVAVGVEVRVVVRVGDTGTLIAGNEAGVTLTPKPFRRLPRINPEISTSATTARLTYSTHRDRCRGGAAGAGRIIGVEGAASRCATSGTMGTSRSFEIARSRSSSISSVLP
jgi:hypothetical protein